MEPPPLNPTEISDLKKSLNDIPSPATPTDSLVPSHALILSSLQDPLLLESLLENGLDPNHILPHQGTLLASACWFGPLAIVSILIGRGADPNHLAGYDDTYKPLAAAATGFHSDVAVVEALLDAGAVISGSGALYGAAQKGRVDVVRCLLRRAADVNERVVIKGRNGERQLDSTALQVAKRYGHENIVNLLLEAGAVDLGLENMGKEKAVESGST
ncbi:hypothetical protein BP5796_09707 [Coleophoma crateriformis]|uniref:Uncharacterized protein n=1 Tax=Coleophoma crateriformis TaxID=565419 RepID=A0A3D8QZ47_9HELO|nr:hypothetical protein BP5796_09707 [Coleophoma crateriformis]